MTNEELVNEIQQGRRDLAAQLWAQNQDFIRMCADGFHAGDLTDDLIQEGYLGIMDAVDRFDSTRGFKFLTFAAYHIRQRMRRFLAKARPGVRLPEGMALKARRYERFVADFLRDNGREPSDLEAAVALQMPDIERVRMAALDPSSLDQTIDEDGRTTLGDIHGGISEDCADDVIDQAFQEQLRRDLWAAVDSMPEDLAAVMHLRYEQEMTLADIASEKHIAPETVRGKAAKAMRILRKQEKLRELYEEVYGMGLKGVGVRRFLDTWTSSTEYTALQLLEKETKRKQKGQHDDNETKSETLYLAGPADGAAR